MKLIEKKEAVKAEVVPKLIFGEKYITTGKARNSVFPVGTEVLLVTTAIDYDGEVEVATEQNTGWIKPKYLKPVTVNVSELVKGKKYKVRGNSTFGTVIDGQELYFTGQVFEDGTVVVSPNENAWEGSVVKPEQLTPVTEDIPATFTVELTDDEAQVVTACMATVSIQEIEDALQGQGFSPEAAKISFTLFKELQQLLEGGR